MNGAPAPVAQGNMPRITLPQWLAFVTFLVFVLLSVFSNSTVTGDEYTEVRKLAVFLIAALLPSDALIRFGRALFAKDAPDAAAAVSTAPRATIPQYLAFATYVVVVLMTLLSNKLVSTSEFEEINRVAVFLIAALLPSDAAIRFGRALYLKDSPTLTGTDPRLAKI